MIQTDKVRIQSEEIPRMIVVMNNFTLYKYIEIAQIFAGIGFLFFLRNDLLKGIGLGLAIQSSIMLLLDIVAAAIGEVYLSFLKELF